MHRSNLSAPNGTNYTNSAELYLQEIQGLHSLQRPHGLQNCTKWTTYSAFTLHTVYKLCKPVFEPQMNQYNLTNLRPGTRYRVKIAPLMNDGKLRGVYSSWVKVRTLPGKCLISKYRTSAAPVSQRSWVQIPYGLEIFFRSYLQLLVSVVFLAARIF